MNDRFVVYWGGKPVIDTGWVGSSSSSERGDLRNYLKRKGYTDFQARIASENNGPNGSAYFIKTERYPTTAEIVVWGIENTGWQFTLQCPNENNLDDTAPNGQNKLINLPSDFQRYAAANEEEKVIVNGQDVTPFLINRSNGMPFLIKSKDSPSGGGE